MNKDYLTELLKLMNDHPGVPVLPMVGTDIVAGDYYAWWSASWGSSELKKCCICDERIVFWDDDYIWETAEDMNLDYDAIGIDEDMPHDKAELIVREALNRLLWVEVIVVYIRTPDDIIPDNTRTVHKIHEGRVNKEGQKV